MLWAVSLGQQGYDQREAQKAQVPGSGAYMDWGLQDPFPGEPL